MSGLALVGIHRLQITFAQDLKRFRGTNTDIETFRRRPTRSEVSDKECHEWRRAGGSRLTRVRFWSLYERINTSIKHLHSVWNKTSSYVCCSTIWTEIFELPQLDRVVTCNYHSVNSSSHSVNGDVAIQWEWSNFEPSQNPNPLTDYDKTLHN